MSTVTGGRQRVLFMPAGDEGSPGGGDLEGREKLNLRARQMAGEVADLEERARSLPTDLQGRCLQEIEKLKTEASRVERLLEPLGQNQEAEWQEIEPKLEELWRSLERGIAEVNMMLSVAEREAGS